MGLTGKRIRLNRIFNPKTGKTFMVALDHGISSGPLEGIEDLGETLRKLFAGERKPDAVLMNPSMIRRYHEILSGVVGIAARIDGTATRLGPNPTDYRLFSSVEEALSIGADAVVTMAFMGVEGEGRELEKVGKVSEECARWGMPYIVEPLPPEIIEHHFKARATWKWPDPEHVRIVDRSAAERGADVIKSYYTGDPDSFRRVVRSCPAPIIVLSGPKTDDPEGLLRMIRDSLEAGAKGVVMGRNIWGYRDPTKIVQAVSAIIHENFSLEEALKLLR